MPPEVLTHISSWVKDLTLTGALIFILVGGYRGLWVWGPLHREMLKALLDQLIECRKDRDEWKERSLKSDSLLEWAASIAEAEAKRRK